MRLELRRHAEAVAARVWMLSVRNAVAPAATHASIARRFHEETQAHVTEPKPDHACSVPAAGRENHRRATASSAVPDSPIIPFIEGDGTGPDIWRASVRVFDAAVAKAYGGRRKIHWMEVYRGREGQQGLQHLAAG